MSQTAARPSFKNVLEPATADELAEMLVHAAENGQPVCPTGGLTALGQGIPIDADSTAIATRQLNQVVDYPHDDMTITVGAGISVAELRRILDEQGQRLPVEIPQDEQATLGGAVATNQSGPRRFGCGTLRDYVIGITAVDGRGVMFSGGGRVVKNVAGYDFCKLLIGSRGTLAVITQITLKVLPKPEASAMLCAKISDADNLSDVLNGVAASSLTPVSIDFAQGAAWHEQFPEHARSGSWGQILLGYEGTHDELIWLREQTLEQSRSWGARFHEVEENAVAGTWQSLTEFPAADPSTVTFVANMRPSGIPEFLSVVAKHDPQASVVARAGNGVAYVRSALGGAEAISLHAKALLPQARKLDGNCQIYAAPSDLELTPLAAYGGPAEAADVIRNVKQTFDPNGILGRYALGS